MPETITVPTFLEELAEASRVALAEGSVLSFGLVDVDNFADLNEAHGRETGDAVLEALFAILRGGLPPEAEIARIGGDEFGVSLPGTEPEEAFLLLERMRAAAGEKGIASVPFTVSVGVASLPKDGKRGPELLRKADAALFRAKERGRNRVCLPPDEPMVAKTSHYTQTQLYWLSRLAKEGGVGEAELLREAMDDFLFKHRR